MVAYKVSDDPEEAVTVKKRLIKSGLPGDIWISTGIKIIPRKKYFLVAFSFIDPKKAKKKLVEIKRTNANARLGFTPDSQTVLISVGENFYFEKRI